MPPLCKKIKPILDELITGFETKVLIFKLDAEDDFEITKMFKCKSVPMLIFIKDRLQLETYIGSLPNAKLAERINKYSS